MNRKDEIRLAEQLAATDRIAVLTGAGISAESGVPTFRGAGGFWRGQRAEDLATLAGFERDPTGVWEFYDWRRTELSACRPNAGHEALAELEERSDGFHIVTQNVDGLHQTAGSKSVLELHGNIWRVRCMAGCGEREDRRTPLPLPLPPRCRCGTAERPGVVWFGEMLPPGAYEAAARNASRAGVYLVIGTSGFVEPAASLARVAREAGAIVVEINPEQTPLSRVAQLTIREPAAAALRRIVDHVAEIA